MILDAIERGSGWTGTFELNSDPPSVTLEGRRVLILSPLQRGEMAISLIGQDKLFYVRACDRAAERLVNEVAQASGRGLVWIAGANERSVILHLQIFLRGLSFPKENPLRLRVTESIQDDLPASERKSALSFLRNEFLDGDIAIAQTGNRREPDAFRLIGEKWTLDLSVGRSGLPHTRRLLRRKNGYDSDRLTLMRGAILFEDGTLGNTDSTEISNQLKSLLGTKGSYLRTWEIYNELETVLLNLQSEEVGTVDYERYSVSWLDDQRLFVFHLNQDAPPAFRRLDAAIEATALMDDEEGLEPRWILVGEALPKDQGRKLIVQAFDEVSEAIPAKGKLRISQRGDQTRIRRRNRALAAVSEGSTPLTTLALHLEAKDAPTIEKRHAQPLNDRAKRLLGNAPTSAQRDALEVALNTPDIALIQGPPGTGKTSVIRALVSRMADLAEKNERRQGDLGESAAVLVTSHQHDAVENAVDGFDVGGLPAYRFSRRRGETDDSQESGIREWVKSRVESCQRHLQTFGGTPARQLARDTDRLIEEWWQSGTQDERLSIAGKALERTSQYLDPSVTHKAFSMLTQERPSLTADPVESITKKRLLDRLSYLVSVQRLTPESFAADGQLQAERLLKFLVENSNLLKVDLSVELKQAASGDIDGSDFYDRISAQNSALISRANLEEEGFDQKLIEDQAFEEVWTEISKALHDAADSGRDAVAEALQAFIDDLEDPLEVRRMIQKYAQAVASTCQQSVSRVYAEGKAEFEMVIVDEAARAHPLDLLIPLSRARRVVLVGDHFQLPQMLEPEVVEAFKAQHPDADISLLEQSVFERLFKHFSEIERRGGPRRAVSLTDDFRMHPTISQFVSHQFYGDTVRARCAPRERHHELGLYANKPLAWIDVPLSKGRETDERSKCRSIEADILFAELHKIVERSAEFSIGVVTFYERQAALLEERRIALPYDARRRIRIGTVDAFQGREFDIVLLSTVRSNSERVDLKRRVGFLSSRNRLCVAFSRAKRLMITVGDAETVAGTEESQAVPDLFQLLQLCRREEGYYECR